jgi:hypothetical protein
MVAVADRFVEQSAARLRWSAVRHDQPAPLSHATISLRKAHHEDPDTCC